MTVKVNKPHWESEGDPGDQGPVSAPGRASLSLPNSEYRKDFPAQQETSALKLLVQINPLRTQSQAVVAMPLIPAFWEAEVGGFLSSRPA